MPEALTIGWLLNKLWVLLALLYFHNKRKTDLESRERDATISKLQLDVAAAPSTFVSENQMKDAIREALEPYKEDQQEIKVLLRGLNDQIFSLSKDMAVQNALRSIDNITS